MPEPQQTTGAPAGAAADPAAEPLVLVRREGVVTRITLNRPRAINALTTEMAENVHDAVRRANADGSTLIVLDGAGERGFCGGGDVKAMAAGIGRDDAAERFLATEYRADHAVAVSRVPVLGVMDGITMGGGIGLTGHAAIRVVTERSRLAMPETRIGIVPDVGGHLLLSRAPGRLGELLAATSGAMTAGDAIALGFADHFVPSERLDELRDALGAGEAPEAVLARVAEPPPASELLAAREWVDVIGDEALASIADDPCGAALRFVRALEASREPAARAAAESIRGLCPTSVVVTLAQLARTRSEALDLAGVLADDLRVLGRLMGRPDFTEGVRAQVIDKDAAPRWIPARLEDVDRAEIADVLDPRPRPGETPLRLG